VAGVEADRPVSSRNSPAEPTGLFLEGRHSLGALALCDCFLFGPQSVEVHEHDGRQAGGENRVLEYQLLHEGNRDGGKCGYNWYTVVCLR
jgi:hypothetical protein